MYTVIGHKTNRAFRVIWMLEELEQPYEYIGAKPHSEELRKANPSGKSPALLVDGEAITDSAAIMTYLADKHGKLTYPAGTLERARQDAALHLVLDEIDAVLWTAARHSFILPEDKRVPEVKESLKWEYSRNLQRIMDNMAGDYLAGDMVTVPDLILAHCGSWAMAAKFPTDNDAFKTYIKRLRARPAFERAANV
jgi:glutathione S-transferase